MKTIFLSYSVRDREAVRRVREVLGRQGVPTFFDRVNQTPGLPWFDEIEQALAASGAIAVFIGPGPLGSIQKREMQLALQRQAEMETRGERLSVVPVLLEQARVDALTGFLSLNTWLDLRGRDLDDPSTLEPLKRIAAAGEPPRPPRSAACPFRGLEPFREQDAPLFFGRESAVSALLDLVGARSFVGVVGRSGSGKSSLIHAGVLPRLRRQQPPDQTWEIATLSPGARPFQRLAFEVLRLAAPETQSDVDTVLQAEEVAPRLAGETSLGPFIDLVLRDLPATARLLLVIDQFEELFTLTPPETARKRFVDVLLEAADQARCHVVVSLRADFYGQVLGLSRRLSDGLARGQFNVGPARDDELRGAVEGPAGVAGLTFEDGLLDRILEDSRDQPGNLPLLEFALTELWQESAGAALLTHDAYKRIGGVAGALVRRADATLLKLDAAGQAAAPAVLPRLVHVAHVTEEGTDARQILRVGDLEPLHRTVVQAFAAARLLVLGNEVTGEDTVQVAHESLIRSWPRLRQWVDDEREFLLWLPRLSLFMDEFERGGRDRSALLHGPLLRDAARWLRERPRLLHERERTFIRESIAADRGGRRLRHAAVAAVVMVAVAGLAALASVAYSRTDAYQLRYVRDHAPVEKAQMSSYSRADRHTEALQDWARAVAADGQDVTALVDSTRNGPSEGCMAAAAIDEIDALGRHEEADAHLKRLLGRLRRGSAEADTLECIAWTGPAARGPDAVLALADRTVRNEVPGLDERQRVQAQIALATARLALQDRDRGPAGLDEAVASVAHLSQPMRDDLGVELIDRLVRLDMMERAQAVLPLVEQTYARQEASAVLAVGKAHRGELAAAETLLADLSLERQMAAAGAIAADRVRAGELPAAADFFHGTVAGKREDGGPPASVFATAYAQYGLALARRGLRDQALPLLRTALDLARTDARDDTRSLSLATVAEGFAWCRHLYQARTIADECPSSIHRLRAYAAVLRAGARRE